MNIETKEFNASTVVALKHTSPPLDGEGLRAVLVILRSSILSRMTALNAVNQLL